MKYIDAEKLKVLLSDLKENHKHYKGDFHEGVVFTVNEIEEEIEEIINSLQQEQPEVECEDLEEAVEKHINEALYKWSYDDEDGIEQYVYDAFLAGAEWQKKNIISLIESRLLEIIGDAQPKPALRAEVQELIEKIKKDEK